MKICAFVFENSFAFLRYHKKTSLLNILSLIASLLPLSLAIANIQVMGEFMPSIHIHNADNVRIISTTDVDEAATIYNACRYPVSAERAAGKLRDIRQAGRTVFIQCARAQQQRDHQIKNEAGDKPKLVSRVLPEFRKIKKFQENSVLY